MRLYELLFEGADEKISHIVKSMAGKIVAAAYHDHSAEDLLTKLQSAMDPKVDEKTFTLGAADAILRRLVKADPSGERADALVWVARMYAAREFLLEDITGLRNDLHKFFRYRTRIPNKDLNSYKNLNQLYDAIEAVEGDEPPISGKQAQKLAKVQGAEKVIETPDISVVKLLTPEAANIYGKGTKWCTTSENGGHFNSYSAQGPLYAIIVNSAGNQRKFQFHFESSQFMNERDRPVDQNDIAMLSKYDGYTQFLNLMIKKHYGRYFEEYDNKSA